MTQLQKDIPDISQHTHAYWPWFLTTEIASLKSYNSKKFWTVNDNISNSWHNGSVFVFCSGACYECVQVTSCGAGC